MPETLSRAKFAEYLGSRIRLYYGAAEPLDAEIVEVKALLRSRAALAGGASGVNESFSLLLQGPKDPCLPQKIYLLEHPELGQLELFLVPIGRDERGTRYEAVFAFAEDH